MTAHVHDCRTCHGYYDCGLEDCEIEQDAECVFCRLRALKARHARLRKAATDYRRAVDRAVSHSGLVKPAGALDAALAEEGE